MNKPSKFLTVVVGAMLAVGSQLPASPAGAATEVLTPVSELNWLNGDVTSVAFDPSGRLWAWNVGYLGENHTGFKTNVFTIDNSNALQFSMSFKPKKYSLNDMSFDTAGTMYADNYSKTVLVTTFKPTGAVKKSTKFKLPRASAQLFVTSNNHLYTFYDGRIDEYLLPLKKHSSPIRSLHTTAGIHSQIAANSAGDVYVTQSETLDSGVDVYTASQSGTVSPDHSFTIDPSLGDGYITDITFTNSGNLAIGYSHAGIAIFSQATVGTGQTPISWFPDTDNATYVGVAFNSTADMAVADFRSTNSIKLYAGMGCRVRPQDRC
jgi:hypothetical protein